MPLSFHMYGPFSIHIYGFMIVLGLFAAYFLLMQDKKQKMLISEDQLQTAIALSIVSGIVGGKLLFLIEYCLVSSCSWVDIFCFWQTGFSVLGTFIGIIATSSWYLYRQNIPVFALFDRVFLYVPFMFFISRFGCLCAGCCYGIPTLSKIGICYSNPESLAPLGISLHPTQLYSSGAELFLFLLLYFFIQHVLKKPGQLFAAYLMGMAFERFLIDFLRGDRTLITQYLSLSQLVALGVCMFSCLIMALATADYFAYLPKKKQLDNA